MPRDDPTDACLPWEGTQQDWDGPSGRRVASCCWDLSVAVSVHLADTSLLPHLLPDSIWSNTGCLATCSGPGGLENRSEMSNYVQSSLRTHSGL